MFTLLAGLVLGQVPVDYNRTLLPNPFGGQPRLLVWFEPLKRLDPPKLSPKKFGEDKTPFEFDFYTGGYARVSPADTALKVRFQVFEQQRKEKGDLAYSVTQMLLRLWEYNYNHLKLDHSSRIDDGMIEVFLCWGGTPGGEQLFDTDTSRSRTGDQKVNTIYVYDLPSFTKPVEMVREIAHEYGHATMPHVGGFKTPEDWADGYLGERLFMTYLRDELAKGELKPEDAMGATAKDLSAWVKENVDPLVLYAASDPPSAAQLGATGQAAMNAYMGLMLYCSQILPEPVFQQIIRLMSSPDPRDLPGLILMAIDHSQAFSLNIPAALKGKPIWIPVSNAKVEGAPIEKLKDGWALIRPNGAPIRLVNPTR